MKIIQLLNKIAKGEEVPRKFTYKGYLWEYDVKNKMWFYYFGESKSHRFDRLFYLNMILNDEVEILEEEKKIPEKLGYFDLTKDKNEKDENGNDLELHYTGVADTFDDVYEKINEIIDTLEMLNDKIK